MIRRRFRPVSKRLPVRPNLLLVALMSVMGASEALGIARNVPEDYPTIQAAVDAAADGDSVLVAPGSYSGPGFTNVSLLGKRLVVAGREPQPETVLDGGGTARAFLVQSGEALGTIISGFTLLQCQASPNGGAILVADASLSIEDCVFRQNFAPLGGALWVERGNVAVKRCTFEGNYGGEGAAIWASDCNLKIFGSVFYANTALDNGGGFICLNSRVGIESCTFVYNTANNFGSCFTAAVQSNVIVERTIVCANLYQPPFYCSASTITFSCTDSFGGVGGNWRDCFPDQAGRNGNISVNPLFCDVDDLTLQADSPCLPGNHPNGADCGLIGALGAGCGFPNAVERQTWGRVKGFFSR